jgi:uncharacterized protein YerC
MKVRAKNLTKEQFIETLDSLYTAAGSVKGRSAMKLFLRDLLTGSERIMLGRRIIIARCLLRGDSYRKIQESLRVGLGTVMSVQRWLHDQMPEYEDAIRGLERELDKRKERAEDKARWRNLKRKYPLHFLLFPW